MTRPRGVVRPVVQAVFAALLVACATAGTIGRRARPTRGYRCPRCGHECR